MNIFNIVFLSFVIFLTGVCGTIISRRFLNVMISFQFLILSSMINFYAFSLFIYNLSFWDKTFVFFAFSALYFFLFTLVFYNYSKQTNIYWLDVMADCRLFKTEKSDWWGDEQDEPS